MIAGVKIKKLKVMPDERGHLMEMLRCDDDLFQKFGQIYLTTTYPGVVKAWHLHTRQTDNIVCVRGMIKLVLFDPREDSPTHGEVEQIFLGIHNPLLVQVPPQVYHGWMCISPEEAYMVNCPTEPYDPADPDEVRIDPHVNSIPYDWSRKDG
jgi:dTDP-4-dehydrorhamnose 3,5-epimerase